MSGMTELDSRIIEIQQKVNRVIAIYDLELNPPLTESEISKIERHYDIAFPAEYRAFVTRIANGVTVPYFSLFSLQKSLTYLDWESSAYNDFLKTPFIHTSAYNPDEDSKLLQLEEELNQGKISEAEFNLICDYLTAGTLIISDSGCGYYERLVITGATRGKVWGDGNVPGQGFLPRNWSFLDWYEKCLQGEC